MALIVELFRNKRDKNNYLVIEHKFSKWEWNKLIEIGKNNGWKQMGTIKPAKDEFTSFKPDYEPDYPFYKIISTDDAHNWGNSLLKFYQNLTDLPENGVAIELKAPILISQKKDSIDVKKRGITKQTIKEYIQFLKIGEFKFWWDD